MFIYLKPKILFGQQLLLDGVCELMALQPIFCLGRWLHRQFFPFPFTLPARYCIWCENVNTEIVSLCGTSLDAQHRLSGKFVVLQAKTSMDEWSVDRICLLRIFQLIGIFPSVDCFSAHFNTVCPTFFHGARAGVNFFMQQLLPDIVYFCCPLVKPIISCCRHLVALGLSVICCFQTGQAQDFGKLFSPKKSLLYEVLSFSSRT